MKRLDCIVEMNDGRVLEVTTAMSDYMRYEDAARKNGWGSMSQNSARWETFAAWSALQRTGQYPGTFEAFVNDVAMVDGSPRVVPPTNPESGDA